jgi:hypothetical protein
MGPAAERGDGGLPRVQVCFGNQVLVVRGNQQTGLLKRMDKGRVEPGTLHGLDEVMFDVFQGWGIKEKPVVGTWFVAEPLAKLVSLLVQQGQGLGGHRDLAQELPLFVGGPGEALAPTAVFVFLAAAAGAWAVTRLFISRHAFLRRGV